MKKKNKYLIFFLLTCITLFSCSSNQEEKVSFEKIIVHDQIDEIKSKIITIFTTTSACKNKEKIEKSEDSSIIFFSIV